MAKRGEVKSPVAQGNASDLIATLLGRAPKVAMTVAAGQLVLPTARKLHEKARERTTYTVKVPGNDEIYDVLHEWVLGLLPPRDQHALVAWTSNRDRPTSIEEGGGRQRPSRLRLRYDSASEQSVTVGGHKIRVAVSEPDPAKDERFRRPEMVFTTYSLDARQCLIEEIGRVAQSSRSANRQPVFRMLNKWGDWERLDDLPDRALDSVILPAGQLERLIADVGRFLSSEADYVRRCVPWHRGHLYEGRPGTGKTSVARAIAAHFGMDIWYLPLADVKKDSDLLANINRVGSRSMLLLEDADVFHAATARDEDGGATLSGLLNALDGIATPHGLFTVLTSNDFEVLDSAVIRAGRVDLVEHFADADEGQVSRLLTRWYGQPCIGDGISGLSPAQVVEVCKRHDDPHDAYRELLGASAREPVSSRE